jgi:hypothetical protein
LVDDDGDSKEPLVSFEEGGLVPVSISLDRERVTRSRVEVGDETMGW